MRQFVRYVAVGLLMVTGTSAVASTPQAGAADAATFRGLTPARLLDTRTPFVTVDGEFGGLGRVAAGGRVDLVVANRGGVPAADVGSVALNVTVSEPTGDGYVTVYPTGAARPTASNVNYVAGQTVPNMVIVGVGTDGRVTLFTSNPAHLIVDVLGWFPAGGAFNPLMPARLIETRCGREFSTVDGRGKCLGNVAPHDDEAYAIVGRGGLPDVAGVAGAVALNVTSTGSTLPGFFTVFPRNVPRPTASNLNFVGGQTVPNMVIVPMTIAGNIAFYNGSDSESDLVVDLLGWFPAGPSFTALPASRLMDTRSGESTIDGQYLGIGSVGAGGTQNLKVTDRASVPAANVGAVVLNVTVTNPTNSGYLTVFPKGAAQPTASNLNFAAGQTIANMVIVPVGADGEVSLFNFAGRSDVIVDVMGWFPVP